MIRQGQVDLKPLILRPNSKPKRQIWQGAVWEYQVSATSYSSAWSFTFTTSAETFKAAKLCLIFPKYCKTFVICSSLRILHCFLNRSISTIMDYCCSRFIICWVSIKYEFSHLKNVNSYILWCLLFSSTVLKVAFFFFEY